MRKYKKLGLTWYDWQCPFNPDKNHYWQRQRLLKLCETAVKNKRCSSNTTGCLINGFVYVDKGILYKYLRKERNRIISDDYNIVINPECITKIYY